MKFWPRDALARITIEDDKKFLLSMMSDRKATMGGADGVLTATEKKRHLRKSAEEEREKKEKLRKESAEAQEGEADKEDEDVDEEHEDVVPITPTRSHKQVVKTGSPAFCPHDVMRHPSVVESATRNKISGTQLSALTHSFITATSGDHNRINLHAKTAYK